MAEKRRQLSGKTFSIDVPLDLYTALRESQGDLCAICGKPETIIDNRSGKTRSLSVDHDHNTGEIRGLLCFICNTRLYAAENEAFLLSCSTYLSTPPARKIVKRDRSEGKLVEDTGK